MRKRVFAALPVLLFLQAGYLFLQTKKPETPQQVKQQGPFVATVEVVNILVTATDKKGRFVTDLMQQDFKVFEDGKPQEITNFTKQTNLPLNIAFLIDTSSSVQVKLGFEKEAAVNFIQSVMRDNDKALLVEFDSGVTLLQDFTSNATEISAKIAKLRAGGGTALYDAVYQATTQKLQNIVGRKVILILSDGDDLDSRIGFDQVLQKLRESDIIAYAISTSAYGASGDTKGDKVLKRLTEETGGKVYFPYTARQMDQYFELINQELRSQYNIAYKSSNPKKDGAFREIKIKTARDDVHLRHRKGYVIRAS
ncbi:MAG TPA: VWA domain-containing protein [Acidobacteriota bacterium]|jgi:VWFA-related protein|nr:VWA domain-containing protein [Acidobacteriota bacterium]